MENDTATKRDKLEELILKKRQQEDSEKEASRQKRQREDEINDIDFGDDSDDELLREKGKFYSCIANFRAALFLNLVCTLACRCFQSW